MSEQVFEASMNFDREHISPFVRQIASLFSAGFSESDAETISTLTDSLDVGEEREIRFKVVHEGHSEELLVRLYMDDVDAPDIYFFGSKNLIRQVDAEMERFSEEFGL